MKKIIVVNTSPRANGNCAAAAKLIAETVKDAEVEIFNLREKSAAPCQACNACKAKDSVWCVQKDDMADLLPRLDGCDALAVLSPIYFGALNGPAKTFLDRIYPFFNPAKPGMSIASKSGKKCAVIVTAGSMPREILLVQAQTFAKSLGVAGFTDTRAAAFNSAVSPDIFSTAEDADAVRELAAWLEN